MSAPKKASRLELVGVAGLLVVGAGAAMYLTSPTVSGQLTVGTRTLEAERCSGFVNGVEIWLAGEGYDAITAGARADGSLRLLCGQVCSGHRPVDGRDVLACRLGS